MTDAQSFIIESREQLLSVLAEAAEIEHHLMCCYLYAAFSFKQDPDEDLTEAELAAVRRWRAEVLHVAIEEMAHLALVSNLSAAIGGAPHFGRQNFPVPAGYHPADIIVKLAPFNYETLRHFIFLERPEGAAVTDGRGFESPRSYVRLALAGRLMPTSQDYHTVGVLYRAIGDGLRQLAQLHGETNLFVGNPEHQLGPELVNLPGLARVRCLKTASIALDGIVTQGEGAADATETSHYQRFLRIQAEFDALRATRPAFVPARAAAHNPVMRRPPTPEGKVWINASPASQLLDLANAAYTHMLRLLMQAYAETRGTAVQRVLTDAAIDLMFVISPVASELTRLPANADHPDCTAGISFATVRGSSALPAGPWADFVLTERLGEISRTAAAVVTGMPRLAAVTKQLETLSSRFSKGLADAALASRASRSAASANPPPTVNGPNPMNDPNPVSAAVPTPAPASKVTEGVEVAPGTFLTLKFEAQRCIHARHCVLGLPQVFKANVQGPWLAPDASSTEDLVIIAHMCPSGAIQYTRRDGGPQEAAPPVNLLQLRENGPLGWRADLHLDGQPLGYRATLCRCGASRRKPFCDGSHNDIKFVASGEPATRASEPLAMRNGPIEIHPQPNGPLQVRGNLEICAGTGRTVDRVSRAQLCRCGGSADKPFCDGTHARIGFVAE